ncbi:hypothetical protein [Acanthopleuribacter pedis]|uniref:Uncharacterized protein n=1 Tax=Acanthopleuribacter pedis TaxID=442870 RepID=A0A8J7QLI2_9BACT|nr:hypothetical protein [Acanthopleuribacter pedis]MBO1320185.1 hypothetical protein [Acanthopleuribacter pedis]
MDLNPITSRLTKELKLEQCFLFEKEGRQWVGDQPSSQLRQFLGKLFQSKPEDYFTEIRFFQMREEKNAVLFLALVPIKIRETELRFLGLIYNQQDHFQELLRYRVLPTHLRMWVHQIAVEERLRNKDNPQSKMLLDALDEKRIYAEQLEEKVQTLRDQLNRIREQGMDHDQEISAMRKLLVHQEEEYRSLSEAYQDLFETFEQMQGEHIATCVDFEQTIFHLEEENDELVRDLAARSNLRIGHIRKQRDEHRQMKDDLEKAQAESARYKEQWETLKASYGSMTPEKLDALRSTMNQLESKLAYYRKRCLELELN